MSDLGEDLRVRWWHGVLAFVGLAVLVWSGASIFGLWPVVVWCVLARTRLTGLIVGTVLLGLLSWFVLPGKLGWSGPWVPSGMELFWLYPVLAAVVCLTGVLVERRRPAGFKPLLTMVAFGWLGAAFFLVTNLEGKPGSEGVLPEPAGLQVVEGPGSCGSGNCAREITATGDRPLEAMRAHLASRGFSAAEPLGGNERMCRERGLVVTDEVCAELRQLLPGGVQVTWYVN